MFPRCMKCHTCHVCHTHKDARAFAANGKTCIECSNREITWRCDACGELKAAVNFDSDVLANASKSGRRRVCLACAATGFSPRDVQAYPCVECGKKGHLKFARTALDNYKRPDRHITLLCTDCIDKDKSIQKRLRAKNSLRCTCPGRLASRQHLPSNEKCDLYPRFAGEERWPGKNNDVSREDFRFHERMAKRRKT